MQQDYDYIIVCAGVCGLVLAKELAAKGKSILVLEKGGFINKLGTVWYAALFYDHVALLKSKQGVTIYRTFGVGGTSIVSCGNAVDFTDSEYKRIGIDFKNEINQAKEECFVRSAGLQVGSASRKIMQEANRLGYTMQPMPKFALKERCYACGCCAVGCPHGLRWHSGHLLGAIRERVDLITGFSVRKVLEQGNRAVGIEGRHKGMTKRFYAEKIILSAGGLGTPIILQNSGIPAGENLFVDLFNMTYAQLKGFLQRKEVPMSVVCTKFHSSDGFVMAPFVDPNFIALFTGLTFSKLHYLFKIDGLVGIMTKVNDDCYGRVNIDGSIDKGCTEDDLKKLNKGSDIAKEILIACGAQSEAIFVTKPKGAHPGGTAAIGQVVDKDLQTKLSGLYVCDASVLPFAPGLPPILTLIGLSKWFAKRI